MRFNDLPDNEKLAVYQALYKIIAEKVSTKDPDSLRSQIDEEYRELYELTGSKSFDVKLSGNVVGTYSIKFSKEQDSKTEMAFEVCDFEDLAEWFDQEAPKSVMEEYAAQNLEAFAKFYFAHTGEIPNGCKFQKHITPAVEKHYIGGMLKVDTESVANAISDSLPGVAGLLAGGFDE